MASHVVAQGSEVWSVLTQLRRLSRAEPHSSCEDRSLRGCKSRPGWREDTAPAAGQDGARQRSSTTQAQIEPPVSQNKVRRHTKGARAAGRTEPGGAAWGCASAGSCTGMRPPAPVQGLRIAVGEWSTCGKVVELSTKTSVAAGTAPPVISLPLLDLTMAQLACLAVPLSIWAQKT